MLDAYIIDRIRREREKRDSGRLPLKVELPEGPMAPSRRDNNTEKKKDKPERGVVIIDFSI